MIYPKITEYIQAITSEESNFTSLKKLHPVLDEKGRPIFKRGNCSVVFKMQDSESKEYYALKCYIDYALKCYIAKPNGLEDTYLVLEKELSNQSKYIINFKYYSQELLVSTRFGTSYFPVVLMDWIDGLTLDSYIKSTFEEYNNCPLINVEGIMESLYDKFRDMASWLLSQSFAHGSMNLNNIILKNNELYLIDYDNFYVSSMKGTRERDIWAEDYRHPIYKKHDSDAHVDDFSIIIILLSLKALSINPKLFNNYGKRNGNLFTVSDLADISQSKIVHEMCKLLYDVEFQKLFGIFHAVMAEGFINPTIANSLYPEVFSNHAKITNEHSSFHEKMRIFKQQIDQIIKENGFNTENVGIYYTKTGGCKISVNPKRFNRVRIGIGYQSTWNEWNCDLEDFHLKIVNWGGNKYISIKVKDIEIVRIPMSNIDRNWIKFAGDGWTHFSVSGELFYNSGDEYGRYNDL